MTRKRKPQSKHKLGRFSILLTLFAAIALFACLFVCAVLLSIDSIRSEDALTYTYARVYVCVCLIKWIKFIRIRMHPIYSTLYGSYGESKSSHTFCDTMICAPVMFAHSLSAENSTHSVDDTRVDTPFDFMRFFFLVAAAFVAAMFISWVKRWVSQWFRRARICDEACILRQSDLVVVCIFICRRVEKNPHKKTIKWKKRMNWVKH